MLKEVAQDTYRQLQQLLGEPATAVAQGTSSPPIVDAVAQQAMVTALLTTVKSCSVSVCVCVGSHTLQGLSSFSPPLPSHPQGSHWQKSVAYFQETASFGELQHRQAGRPSDGFSLSTGRTGRVCLREEVASWTADHLRASGE